MANVIGHKEELYNTLQDSSEIVSYNAKLWDKYEKQEKKSIGKEDDGIGIEKSGIENANKDISLVKSKAENDIKSKKIRSLESMIKILEAELENIKSKSEEAKPRDYVSSKANELEWLKSETISKPVIGGNVEGQSSIISTIKNRSNSSNISVVSEESEIRGYASPSQFITTFDNKNLSKYFIRGGPSKRHDEITELLKNDTEVNSKGSDNKIDISKTNNNVLQEIPIVALYLAQPENNLSSLIKSNAQMRPGPETLPHPIGRIGAMRPSIETPPLPAVASTLMLPLSAYIFLALLIIGL
ncbi:hypothetical protein C2G38_2176727 [Gigaspora rosea]|uniref:Uncharacterized protein n=1 Tax=Gigaspora rosea TaxID=44941 RepID=A0A397VHS6_9GLOM|nr:hypothetical protein C2G38_2176727 [Gigaspora rosea]